MRDALACCVVFLLLSAVGSVAWAQRAPVPSSNTQASRVMLFITEDTLDAQGQRQLSYWWSAPERPVPSAAEAAIGASLKAGGVELERVRADVPISRVYRVPVLSNANASALLTLMGAGQGLVGQVVLRPVDLDDPWAQRAWRATAKVSLVQAGQAKELVTVTLERVIVDEDAGRAKDRARAQLTVALGEILAKVVRQSAGPIGVEGSGGERLIVVQSVPNMPIFESLERALLKVQGVDQVRVRWASSGHIALEINPDKQDKDDLIDAAARALVADTLQTESASYKMVRVKPATGGLNAEIIRIEPSSPTQGF